MSRGIETYIFNAVNVELQYLKQSKAIENPSYFCCDDNNEFVYVISESENGGDAHVFLFDQTTGVLTFINKEAINEFYGNGRRQAIHSDLFTC